MARRDSLDAFERSLVWRRAEEVEEVVQAFDIWFCGDESRGENGLDFGAPNEPSILDGVEERADSDTVAAEDEGSVVTIVEADAELATGVVEHGGPVVFVEVDPCFGIAACGEMVAF